MPLPAEQMRAAGFQVNPPATSEDIERLELAWGVTLPAEIHALYLDHDGQPESSGPNGEWLPYRLMSLGEVLERVEFLKSKESIMNDLPEVRKEIIPLWTDDNSNDQVYFLTGMRKGMIGEANHEAPWSIAPQFHSLPSFYKSMTSADSIEYEHTTDFPHDNEDDPARDVAYREAFSKFQQSSDNAHLDYWSANVLNLCPPSRSIDLVNLLGLSSSIRYGNTAIEAARTLSLYQGEISIPFIVDALQTGQADDMTLCSNLIELIGSFGSDTATQALWHLACHATGYMSLYLGKPLKERGYEIQPLKDVTEKNFLGVKIIPPEGTDKAVTILYK